MAPSPMDENMHPKPPRGTSGTEHRDNFKLMTDATASVAPASKAPFNVGPDKTSSLTGCPWVEGRELEKPSWNKTVWMPSAMPASHFRPSSSSYGAIPASPFHHQNMFEKAKESAGVRYLQAPYLAGDMAAGAGIDMRPVSSVGTFSLASNRQAEILADGEQRLAERMAQTAAWTAARSRASKPITSVPDPWLTSTNASYTQRPAADSQQHRLRGFITSPFVPTRSLESAPARCPTAPLEGGNSLHATRYVGVRDSDGARRLIEVDTTGAPAATSPWKLPTAPTPPAELPMPYKFVASQPATTSESYAASALNMEFDPSATTLPRRPLPAENRVTLRHRRPFSMGFRDSMRAYAEHKINSTKLQAANELAAEAAGA